MRLGELELAAEPAACEEGLGDGAGAENDAEEIGEVCASGSSLPAEGELREELCAGYADVRVGGHQLSFGLLDVRAAFEELRRMPVGRSVGGGAVQRVGVSDGAGRLAEEQAELVFGLLDRLIEQRDLGRGGVEELLGLANVESEQRRRFRVSG